MLPNHIQKVVDLHPISNLLKHGSQTHCSMQNNGSIENREQSFVEDSNKREICYFPHN